MTNPDDKSSAPFPYDQPTGPCAHLNFHSSASIGAPLAPLTFRHARFAVHCKDCGKRFVFIGASGKENPTSELNSYITEE